MIRGDQADLVYKTEDAKFAAVIDEIEELSKNGRPILVGTTSVEKSERLSTSRPPRRRARGAQRQAARA